MAAALFALVSPLLLSHHTGVAEHQGKDRTGAPGSETPCLQCHDDSQFNPSLDIDVIDPETSQPVTMYVPGEVYQLQFTVNSTGGTVHGFQATAILDDLSNAGTFQNPGAVVQLESVDSRHIIEHSDANTNNVFEGEWVAPAEGSGDVTFYASSIAANGNNGSSGDGYAGAEITLSEDITSGIGQNIAKDFSAVHTNGMLNVVCPQNGTLEMYSINGQLISTINAPEGRNLFNLDMPQGIVIVSFVPQNGPRVVQKLVNF